MTVSEITSSFVGNLDALRALNERVGGHADQQDRDLVTRALQQVLGLFGVGVRSAINKEPEPISILGTHDGVVAEGELEDVVDQTRRTDLGHGTDLDSTEARKISAEVHAVLSDPDKRLKLERLAQEIRQVKPVQGALLRRGALTTLVSFFEALLADLVQVFYTANPGALPQDNHALTLEQIKKLGSIDDAEQYILERESENLLRQSLDDQLKYFSGRLKVDSAISEEQKVRLVEISQRRNVVVHNNCIINRIYLDKVRKDLIEEYGCTEGIEIKIPLAYLSSSIDVVYIAGILMLQQCWRKWFKADIDAADGVLLEQSYGSLVAGRYESVIHMSDYGDGIRLNNERNSRILTINAVIAHQRLNRNDEAKERLLRRDWSASASIFQLAVAALQNDVDAVCRLLPKAVVGDELSEMQVREWPLFDVVRNDPRFISTSAEVFPQNSFGS